MHDRLLSMVEADRRLRAHLAAIGALEGGGYHPRLRELHEANARELELILDDEGWPTPEEAGADGAEAAFLIAFNALTRPAFMRRCLAFLKAAVVRGDAAPAKAAMLEDRIRVMEGRAQLYGTQLDWDEGGELSPLPLAEPDMVDEHRAAVGLPPLAEAVAQARAQAEAGEAAAAIPRRAAGAGWR